jgi:hypothetical protein
MLYRLRYSLHYRYFKFRTRDVLTSAPMPSDPGARCELHTMLSANDYQMYLVAAKSMLRFRQSLAVVIHSDGSLTADHEADLQKHIPGCTVISREAAEERAAGELGADSFLFRWRKQDVSYRRMIDSELWTRTHKRVMMDSDIVVAREPKKLLEWIRTPNAPGFLLGDPRGQTAALPEAPDITDEHIQKAFRRKLPAISRAMGRPIAFLQNTGAGFYGCTKEVSLAQIEELLRVCLSLKVPMNQWGGEQCMVLYLIATAGGTALDPETCINFLPSDQSKLSRAEIVHFFGTHRFYKHFYTKLAVDALRTLPR